ncbi:hypothetical protein [endosymbiont GvMRE of Glomus versiforme]|uniref:hypothetical protein n=1 Tax=endosymbiont GvMRE of Glomus versiforme TaxID=2039283 RepID=UPI000EE0F5D8|nr:hypothetical protein [endosymbiont GvMRE of Glomus versiforme]RHZ36308.1 hypothetical protein GvMRE_Ic1g187 [endosymbiont GvMRE of Glomus versiforme]
MNWDNHEEVFFFSSQIIATIAKRAKMEEWTDHQVKKRSRWKGKWKGRLFWVLKKATKIPNEWSKKVKLIIILFFERASIL